MDVRIKYKEWAVVVTQLVEQSLLTPEIPASNPVIGIILSTKLSTNCLSEKMKKIKRGREWPILKKVQRIADRCIARSKE